MGTARLTEDIFCSALILNAFNDGDFVTNVSGSSLSCSWNNINQEINSDRIINIRGVSLLKESPSFQFFSVSCRRIEGENPCLLKSFDDGLFLGKNSLEGRSRNISYHGDLVENLSRVIRMPMVNLRSVFVLYRSEDGNI